MRRLLGPLGAVINPHQTSALEPGPGASSVVGVDELRAEGFNPIEELTGFVEVALVWPEAHRRSLPETREWWLEEPLEGQLWLVRPPWVGWIIGDVFSVLWSVVDDYRDHDQRVRAAWETLRWPETKAREHLAVIRDGHDSNDG